MPLTDEQLTLVVALETQLLILDTAIRELEVLQAARSTGAENRARIGEILSDLKLRYALLYPQYKAAETGQSALKPPTDAQFKKISALADKVEMYIRGQKVTDETIVIAGQVLDLIKTLS